MLRLYNKNGTSSTIQVGESSNRWNDIATRCAVPVAVLFSFFLLILYLLLIPVFYHSFLAPAKLIPQSRHLRSTNAKEADVSEAEGSLRTGEEASGSRQKVAEIQQGHTNKIQFVGCQNVNDYLLSQVDEEPTPTIPRIPTKEQVRVVVHLLSLLPLLSYPSRSRDAMRDVSRLPSGLLCCTVTVGGNKWKT